MVHGRHRSQGAGEVVSGGGGGGKAAEGRLVRIWWRRQVPGPGSWERGRDGERAQAPSESGTIHLWEIKKSFRTFFVSPFTKFGNAGLTSESIVDLNQQTNTNVKIPPFLKKAQAASDGDDGNKKPYSSGRKHQTPKKPPFSESQRVRMGDHPRVVIKSSSTNRPGHCDSVWLGSPSVTQWGGVSKFPRFPLWKGLGRGFANLLYI